MIIRLPFALVLLASLFHLNPLKADVITSGSATINLNTSVFGALGLTPDRFYGSGSGASTATGAEIVGGIGGTVINPVPTTLNLLHTINVGAVSNPSDRARQSTVLDINPLTPASTWGVGERIGIDGVLRFALPNSTSFSLGDYSLTFDSSQTRLSIVNNLSFPAEAFRVNAPVFTSGANGFQVEGSLLIGSGLAGFGFTEGSTAGSFSLNAITAVPEPTSSILVMGALAGFGWLRWRRTAPC
jgi:hypothetical protein